MKNLSGRASHSVHAVNAENRPNERAVLVATKPLTNETGWIRMPRIQLVIVSGGQIIGSVGNGRAFSTVRSCPAGVSTR